MAGMSEDAAYRKRLAFISLGVVAGLVILMAAALLVAYISVPL
jgi:hypothetical protein